MKIAEINKAIADYNKAVEAIKAAEKQKREIWKDMRNEIFEIIKTRKEVMFASPVRHVDSYKKEYQLLGAHFVDNNKYYWPEGRVMFKLSVDDKEGLGFPNDANVLCEILKAIIA